MRNRFAVPTPATLVRYRLARDAAMAKARLVYDAAGDARQVIASVAEAREWQRKVLWAQMAVLTRHVLPVSF